MVPTLAVDDHCLAACQPPSLTVCTAFLHMSSHIIKTEKKKKKKTSSEIFVGQIFFVGQGPGLTGLVVNPALHPIPEVT